ncbi:intraflagellar transport protein [Histomonas meleagridis]|uniref:intraflagellar transport protein 52-like n=1 Tax=Histomonas meleagridis TaxID=135588 RepID=UPI0035598734|nr:intraflagellar transport protein [Histomonas meleagridis]KAH0796730.1 intraflagellar transport protein 52-like [Histomonas meleagridis]
MSFSIIDAGHKELYRIDRKLSQFASIIQSYSEPQHFKGILSPDDLKSAKSIWFFGPQKDITPEESTALEAFMLNGGAVFLLSSKLPPNFNAFTKKFGSTINEPVISPTYITYIDPHEITVQGGVVNRSITQYIQIQKPTFAYPNGTNLELRSPAIPLLSSGLSSYPLNQPIISYSKVGTKKGSLVVVGSPSLFNDEWCKHESNELLLKYLIELSIQKTQEINMIDAEHPEITERWYTPDVESMSEKLLSCIQESEKLNSDFHQNFERGSFRMDMSFVAKLPSLAQSLGLKNEPLETVKPQFDAALPPLTPAVFPPQMREPKSPVLELFDLDDAFASPKTRLAQLAQRTSPKNVDTFILQSAKILGISPHLPEDKQTAKDVVEYVFRQIVKWKRQSSE